MESTSALEKIADSLEDGGSWFLQNAGTIYQAMQNHFQAAYNPQ